MNSMTGYEEGSARNLHSIQPGSFNHHPEFRQGVIAKIILPKKI
jgi:hypothetical protein